MKKRESGVKRRDVEIEGGEENKIAQGDVKILSHLTFCLIFIFLPLKKKL